MNDMNSNTQTLSTNTTTTNAPNMHQQQQHVKERTTQDEIIDDFLKKNNNYSINHTNNYHTMMNNTSSSGLSIFGFNDDDDDDDDTNDMDESLLVSPILNDYIGTTTNTTGTTTTGTTTNYGYNGDVNNENNTFSNTIRNQSANNQMPILSSPSATSFMSPTINNNTNTTLTGSSLSSSKSSRCSNHKVRSSARLRRRRQILFSSPREDQFRLQEEEEEEEEEEEQNDVLISNHDDGQSGQKAKDEMNEYIQSNGINNDNNNNNKISNNLLHGALLDTSLCPSLGLGSSIDDDEKNENSHMIEKNNNDNNDYDYDYDYDYYEQKTKSISGNSNSNSSRRSSLSSTSSNGMIINKIDNNDNFERNDKSKSSRRNSRRGSSLSTTHSTSSRLSISSKNGIQEQSHMSTTSSSSHNENIALSTQNNIEGAEKHERTNIQQESIITTLNIHKNEPIEESVIDAGICLENSLNDSNSEEDDNNDDGDDVLSVFCNDIKSSSQPENALLQNKKDITHIVAASSVHDGSQNNENEYSSSHHHDNNTSTLSLKSSFSTPERKSSINQTPPRSSHKKRMNLSLTPKLQEVARQSLTPVLNALRSKLMRSSRQSKENHDDNEDENGVEMVDKLNDVSLLPTDNDTVNKEAVASFPTIGQSEKASYSPALGSLQSSVNNTNGQDRTNDSFHDTSLLSNENFTNLDTKTPGKDDQDKEEQIGDKTPGTISTPSLSLTPALKALRLKLLGKSSIEANSSHKSIDLSVSPIGNSSPYTIDEASLYRGSLFSPPIREALPHRTSNNRSNRTEDDSYLAQPKDLNSAKKNVNAQSSALVTRLRGAAQRRMVDLTKKRDSLAAKEIDHLERMENELNQFVNTIPEEDSVEARNEKNEKQTKPSKSKQRSVFKARPLPASSKDGGTTSGVPKVRRKPATKAISPKLGSKRSTQLQNCNVTGKLANANKSDPFYVSPFKARPLPTFINNDKENRGGVPKVKNHQPTVPVSPLLGLRRNKSKKVQKASKKASKIKFKTNTIESKFFSPLSSTDPVGLDFLANTPTTMADEHNVGQSESSRTFCLHSAMRAKDRAQFNEALSLREKERIQQKRIEMDLLKKQRLRELESMKQSLR